MNDPLLMENSSERLLTFQNDSLWFGSEEIEVNLNGRKDSHAGGTFNLQDDLSGEHPLIDNFLQYSKFHFSLVGLGEGGSHIAIVDQQTPVRLGNIATLHLDDPRQRSSRSLVELIHRIKKVHGCAGSHLRSGQLRRFSIRSGLAWCRMHPLTLFH